MKSKKQKKEEKRQAAIDEFKAGNSRIKSCISCLYSMEDEFTARRTSMDESWLAGAKVDRYGRIPRTYAIKDAGYCKYICKWVDK